MVVAKAIEYAACVVAKIQHNRISFGAKTMLTSNYRIEFSLNRFLPFNFVTVVIAVDVIVFQRCDKPLVKTTAKP